jgi:tRNA G46 methylase TrmB
LATPTAASDAPSPIGSSEQQAGDAKAVALLRAEAGNHVLEIGFGNSRTVANVIAQLADVRYTGIDTSSRLWRKHFASMPR